MTGLNLRKSTVNLQISLKSVNSNEIHLRRKITPYIFEILHHSDHRGSKLPLWSVIEPLILRNDVLNFSKFVEFVLSFKFKRR